MTDPVIRVVAELERARSLTFLAGELDRLCDSVGLDPRVAWRWPRLKDEAEAGCYTGASPHTLAEAPLVGRMAL